MKNIISLFVMVFLMVGTFSFVAAEDAGDVIVPEANKVGFFENQMYKLGLAFTFNKEKKIDKVLEMAEKRLAEAEVLAEEDPEAYAEAQERYDELVARAEEILADIESGAEDVNGSEDYLAKIARIQNQFERHRDHAGEIYGRAMKRFELNNATDEKIERFEMFHDRALDRADEMEDRILERRESAVLKHKALSEMSDEELEDVLERIEESEGLKEAREEREERAEARVEKITEIKNRNIEQARLRLNDSGLGEQQRQQIQERIEEANQRVEEFKERAYERFENRPSFDEQPDDSEDNETELENETA